MQDFFLEYLSNSKKTLKLLDFGSKNINGSYKTIFVGSNIEYLGADIEDGNNVDIVLSDKYEWVEIESESFDVVISGQAIEHMEYPWLVFKTVYRILKTGGMVCIVAPSSGPEHKYPIDCYRFYPDGMRALCKQANLNCLKTFTTNTDSYSDGSELWNDTCVIANKID